MRSKNIGMVAAVVAVGLGSAACGSSGAKASGAAAAGSAPASAAATSASASPSPSPTTSPSKMAPIPFDGSILVTALLDPSAFGGGFAQQDPGDVFSDKPVGLVTDIPGLDCWKVIDVDGAHLGSIASARDEVIKNSNYDLVRQGAFQFNPGEAATMMTDIVNKVGQCAKYDHVMDGNVTTYHEKAQVRTVSGIGDQAIEITESSDSAKFGPDTSVELIARYGDVAVSVSFDSATSSSALAYDVVGKVKAIAAKLRLTPTGS